MFFKRSAGCCADHPYGLGDDLKLDIWRLLLKTPTLIALAALFGSVTAAGAQQSAIERGDFRNGTVIFDKQTYHLKNGQLAAPDKSNSLLRISIDKPVFGYVDGYPGELALVFVHAHDYGATGSFSELNLFGLRGGKPVLIADLPGGDRAEGGFHTATISGRRLVVEVYAPPAGGGVCCPGFVDTVHYRIVAGKLTRDGKPSRRAAIQDKDY